MGVYKPNILILVEMRVHNDRARKFLDNLHFVNLIAIEAYEFMGGIWIFWDNSVQKLEILSYHEQYITVAVSKGVYVD